MPKIKSLNLDFFWLILLDSVKHNVAIKKIMYNPWIYNDEKHNY